MFFKSLAVNKWALSDHLQREYKDNLYLCMDSLPFFQTNNEDMCNYVQKKQFS
jgi:hypothetical protein